jgi:hypothetical protein
MLGAGVFAPILTVPIVGTLNYFANGRGDGVVLLLLALASGILISTNRLHWLFMTGCVSLVILLAAYLNLDARLSVGVGGLGCWRLLAGRRCAQSSTACETPLPLLRRGNPARRYRLQAL